MNDAPAGETVRHILSLSFTELQCEPLIAAAHARGVLVTLAGSARRFEQFATTASKADGQVVVDLRDGDPDTSLELLAAAHRTTPFTGLFVPADPEALLAARLAERIGVPWNSMEAVRRVTSKWETRQTLSRQGFRQPDHFLVSDGDDARTIVAQGGAWIVKPARGTASEGVSKVTALAQVASAVENLRQFQPDGPFVVEQCIAPMTEYSVEGVWFDGRPWVAGITAKRTTGPPHFVETGHTVPVTLAQDLDAEVRDVVRRGLLALGASHGQFHVEVFVQPERPPGARVVFSEGHVRAGGDRITQIMALAGVDLDALAVDAIIGRRPAALPRPTHAAASRYFVFSPGTVVAVTGVDEAAALPGVVHLSIDVGVGDALAPVVGNGARHGRFVVVGETFEQALALADQVEQTVRVDVAAPDRSRLGQPGRPAGAEVAAAVEQDAIRRGGVGLRAHDARLAWPGFTLFCTMTADRSVYLIDMNGELAHRWELPYPPGPYAYLTARGTLLVNGKILDGDDRFGGCKGGALLEMDWNGRVLWEVRHPDHHHDGILLRNGNVLLICLTALDPAVAARVQGGIAGSEDRGVMYGDYFVEMTRDGRVVWEWRSWEHLDPAEDRITAVQQRRIDWTHANAVAELPNGDLVLSFRYISTVVIVERATGRIRWKLKAPPLAHQHAPAPLDNGNLLIFDNGTHRLDHPSPYSRVIEVAVPSGEIVWRYQAPRVIDFFSPYWSNAQRLPNGNTLICDGSFGRIFEVTSGCQVVWEYVNPYFSPPADDPEFPPENRIYRAFRYSPEEVEQARRRPP